MCFLVFFNCNAICILIISHRLWCWGKKKRGRNLVTVYGGGGGGLHHENDVSVGMAILIHSVFSYYYLVIGRECGSHQPGNRQTHRFAKDFHACIGFPIGRHHSAQT